MMYVVLLFHPGSPCCLVHLEYRNPYPAAVLTERHSAMPVTASGNSGNPKQTTVLGGWIVYFGMVCLLFVFG